MAIVSSPDQEKNDTTEIAMQRVWSDILMAADERLVTVLVQLDISAAFDCVDHSMLVYHPWSDVLCASVVSTSLNAVISDRQNTADCLQ